MDFKLNAPFQPTGDQPEAIRAQLLRLLNDLRVKAESQDFIFYIFDHK